MKVPPGIRPDLVPLFEIPDRHQMAHLSQLALQARDPVFFVQDQDGFLDNYVAQYDVLSASSSQPLGVNIGIRGMKSRFPLITIGIEEYYPHEVTPHTGVVKTDTYVFRNFGYYPRQLRYKCDLATQRFSVYENDSRRAAVTPDFTRRQRKEVNGLEERWGTKIFTRDKYDRIIYLLGGFSIANARVGKIEWNR